MKWFQLYPRLGGVAVLVLLISCQESSPCPNIGDSCAEDQSKFRTHNVSLACECVLTDGVLGAALDLTITKDVWALRIENDLQGSVVCVDDDEWLNRPPLPEYSGRQIFHMQLPSGTCCGEGMSKLETAFGEHLLGVGTSKCGDGTFAYPWHHEIQPSE